jgi:hypothetical protein
MLSALPALKWASFKARKTEKRAVPRRMPSMIMMP